MYTGVYLLYTGLYAHTYHWIKRAARTMLQQFVRLSHTHASERVSHAHRAIGVRAGSGQALCALQLPSRPAARRPEAMQRRRVKRPKAVRVDGCHVSARLQQRRHAGRVASLHATSGGV